MTKGKLETLYVGKPRKIIPNNSWCKECVKIKARIYLVLKGNNNTVRQNLRNAAETVFTRKFIVLSDYFGK